MDPENAAQSAAAGAAKRDAFRTVEEKAREVLRERGLTEEQIQAQLQLARRQAPEE